MEVPIFTSYTIGTTPFVTVSDKKQQIYFELEIATQAVRAVRSDGSVYGWQDAWEIALGTKPVVKN